MKEVTRETFRLFYLVKALEVVVSLEKKKDGNLLGGKGLKHFGEKPFCVFLSSEVIAKLEIRGALLGGKGLSMIGEKI